MVLNRLLFLWLCLIESSFISKSQSTNAADFSVDSDVSYLKNIECDQLIPGADRMAHGIDITTLDMFPENTMLDFGYRRVFVEFTCNKKKHWTHDEVEGVTFDWPDQFSAVDSVQSGVTKLSEIFTNDLQLYKKDIEAQVGIESGSFFASFSASASYKYAQERLTVENKSIAEMSAVVSSVTVEYRSPNSINVHPDFANCFKEPNPPKYEQSPERYDEFVQNYGTHYFESATFGGYLHLKTVIEQKYAQNKSKEEISAQMTASFLCFSATTDAHNVDESEHQQFTRNSQTESSYYGGSANIQPKSNQIKQKDPDKSDQPAVHQSIEAYQNAGGKEFYKDWYPTINRNPWLIAGKLKPIENLVSNENFKLELAKALKVYRIKAYIGDVKRMIQLGKLKLSARQMKQIDYFENAVNREDSDEFEKMVSSLDFIIACFEMNDIKFADHLARKFRKEIIEGVFKLQIQLAQKCTASERVDQLKTPMDESIGKYNEYEKNKDNSEKRNNFIEIAERIITSFAEHMQGVCDHLLLNGAPVYKWDECTKCVLDEYNTIGDTKYPALDWMVKHPKHP